MAEDTPDVVKLQHTLYHSRNPTRRWLHRTRRDWIVGALREHCPPEARRILEVGPGSGVYLPALKELAPRVVALDVETAHLEHLTDEHPNVGLIRTDVTRTGLEDGAFDLVLCSEVVEHLPETAPALREIHRILRPGGVLVLSTPQRFSPLELASRVAFLPGVVNVVRWIYREPVLKQGHVNLMTRTRVGRELGATGFETLDTHLSGVYLPLVAELGGGAALDLEKHLETLLRGSPLKWVLWTQYWVVRKPDREAALNPAPPAP